MKKYALASILSLIAIAVLAHPFVSGATTLQQALDQKVSTSTFYSILNPIMSTMTEIGQNLYGTSTTMNVGAASTTQGLLGKSAYSKLNSLSTQVQTDWNAVSGTSSILNKPSLAAVATSGAYVSLTGLPTIPAAQIQSDWTQASTTALDYIKNKPLRAWATSTRSIVTGTGAVGYQVSTSSDATVYYSSTITTTASLAGGQQGTIVLEIAPTNSATSSNWIEIGRCTNGQTVSLAIALTVVQTGGCEVSGYVPSGYYEKLRSISTTGTPTFTFNSGQEVLMK